MRGWGFRVAGASILVRIGPDGKGFCAQLCKNLHATSIDSRSPFVGLRPGGTAEAAVATWFVSTPFSHLFFYLEEKLQGELDLAGGLSFENLIEGWRADVAVGQMEIRMVQEIE